MLLLYARYISWIHPTVRMQINGRGTIAQLIIRARFRNLKILKIAVFKFINS